MASGDTLVVFEPKNGEPPAMNFASLDLRNENPTWDFDAAIVEEVVFPFVLPRHYAGGGITATIIWAASSATSGNCRWEANFERYQDDVDNIDSPSASAFQGVTAGAPVTAGIVSYDEIAFTDGAQIDSLAVGEMGRFRLSRDAVDAADTMTGDAELYRIELRET